MHVLRRSSQPCAHEYEYVCYAGDAFVDTNDPRAVYLCGGTGQNKWAVGSKSMETVAKCTKKKEVEVLEEGTKKKQYEPPALEAQNAREVGGVMIFLLCCLLVVLVLFDLSTVLRDWTIFKANVLTFVHKIKGLKSRGTADPEGTDTDLVIKNK